MMHLMEAGRLQLAVLASGRGSNFDAINEAIIRGSLDADLKILISDHQDAPVLEKAKRNGIPALFINPRSFPDRDHYETRLVEVLQNAGVNLIALAGYMRLVGGVFLQSYRWKILNIHPALLPSFPGLHAQRQALDYGVRFSGCTVHIVDEGMDTGPIIKQAAVPVYPDDDEDTLAQRILAEEHRIYPESLQLIARGRVWLEGRKVMIK